MYAFIFSVMKKRTKKMPGLRILKPAVASDGIILMVLPVKRLFKKLRTGKELSFSSSAVAQNSLCRMGKTLKTRHY